MRNWTEVDALAAAQHRVIAVRQVTALGIPARSAHAMLRRETWAPAGFGTWVHPDASQEDDAVRIEVAVRSVHRPVLLTGGARLAVAGVRPAVPKAIGLLVGPDGSLPKRPDVRLFRGRWVPGDVAESWEGVPCAPVLRAWTDAALVDPVDVLERDLRALHRLRMAELDAVGDYLERRGPFRGRRAAAAALTRAQAELVHSRAEADARTHLRLAGLPLPHRSPLLIRAGGRRLGEIDIPFCSLRYGVEVDGPHHEEPEQHAYDVARDEAMRDVASWNVERFSTAEIERDPAAFVRAVARGLDEAARLDVEPWRCGTDHRRGPGGR